MGLKDWIKSQFIEVIEWTDDSRDTIAYRFPVRNMEIKMGAQLTVRESQAALFVNEGQVADLFAPGRYELATRNLPILTTLRSWKHGFASPFKAEVYFFSLRLFTDLKWGTANPVTVRDPEFGVIRIRAFGIYTVRISDAKKFYKLISGTNELFTVADIEGQLKRTIIGGFSDLLGESKIPFIDMAANQDELGQTLRAKLVAEFETMGLALEKFVVENLSVPPQVEEMLDKRASMGIVGDLNRFTQFQAANALSDAAKNPGGLAGAGVGLGAGVAMGQAFVGAMATPPPGGAAAAGAAAAATACPGCAKPVPVNAKFCPHCGKASAAAATACLKCQAPLAAGSKFCPQCVAAQQAPCPKCGRETPPGKFCAHCGGAL